MSSSAHGHAAAEDSAGSRELGRSVARESLHWRLLAALADEPATPSALAGRLSVASESVSRQLRRLRADGLVISQPVTGDGRLRQYALTTAGEAELRDHRAFAPAQPPPADPTRDDVARFLRVALDRAVAMRRETNALDEAAARLRVVLAQAREARAHDVAIDATAELATTLRQDGKPLQVRNLLAQLQSIALGQDPQIGAALALPSAAHREYALGRLGDESGNDAVSPDTHLVSAANLYAQLAKAPSFGSASAWKRRQAWSYAALAIHLRERSEFENALEHTAIALRLFDEVEDSYGRSHCLFLFGFCLRLLGEFEDAAGCLNDAYKLAERHGYERFKADSLMQMGEVRRCQRRLDDAYQYLFESFQRSERMGLTVTQAFSQSALGAVAYQQDRLDDAAAAFDRAQQLFKQCGRREGFALNARRYAIVARTAADFREVGDFESVDRMIGLALERYRRLCSPAGIMACEIERGRLLRLRSGRASNTVAALIRRLDDTAQRNLLELDPWVPGILATFARETGDERLTRRARKLLSAAERRLSEHAQRAIKLVADAIGGVRSAGRPSRAKSSVDEMGGETRRAIAARAL